MLVCEALILCKIEMQKLHHWEGPGFLPLPPRHEVKVSKTGIHKLFYHSVFH